MEGLAVLPKPKPAPPPTPYKAKPRWWAYLPSVAITAIAFGVHYLPFAPFRVVSGSGARYPVSAAIIAIVAGVLVRNLLPLPRAVVETAKGQAHRIIPITIVLTGAGLNLSRIASIGATASIIIVSCMAIATASAIWIGRLLRLRKHTAFLIGAGTAICGTSAIVAVAPLIEAEDQDMMLSIGTINVLGLTMMFLLPPAGGLLHLRDVAFGVWAGTTIHAVPQAVAAGFAYGPSAGALATLVKLVRVAMLAPFLFIVGFIHARRSSSDVAIRYSRLVPNFVYGFFALALCNTLGLFPILQFRFGSMPLDNVLTNLGELLLTLSMAAMGLEVNVRFLARTGGTALLTGTAASVILCLTSLLLIRLLL